MKKIYTLAVLTATTLLNVACNNEWEDEQYEHYISFSTQLNDKGVTDIYVPYTRHAEDGGYAEGGEGLSNYQLPILISGSTYNQKNLTVHVEHSDTLDALNPARYSTRTDLWYKDLTKREDTKVDKDFVTYPETMQIESGKSKGLLKLNFDFRGIDMREKWVLPLQIAQDPSYGYNAHPRKDYAEAILRIFPFNDYSGDYSGTSLTNAIVTGWREENGKQVPVELPETFTKDKVRGYVVDEKTIFTYAGMVDEEYTDRHKYRVNIQFPEGESGPVTITAPNGEEIDFRLNPDVTASFRQVSSPDAAKPYLLHRYVIINNIDYFYKYSPVAGTEVEYHVKGTLTLSRDINTQIPDEDQAIQW